MRTDRLTVQMVVGFIGVSGVLIICGLIGLAYLGRDIPEPLSTLGGAALGALGTLLARTSTDVITGEERTALPVNTAGSTVDSNAASIAGGRS
jgi:hypothetical protein